ncbi:MAG TPA: beta-L-arabinofuranosidase domain-containing protein [Kofleriaceae bacterium]|nr:beta-L-arabinofuranosidase domain-containing protein [Kofleriaceae bacterium]
MTMVGPTNPSRGALRPLGIDEVRLTDGFWADRQRLNAEVMLPHCRGWIERAGWLDNVRVLAARGPAAGRRGREFSDSEVYKLLEACSWEAGRSGDPAPDAVVAEWGALLAAAQSPDGYIDTNFGRPGQAARYTDLEWGHELYCQGHLIQAGVARLRAHGADDLVGVACRAADHICAEFGPTGRNAICGHPEVETALVELYRATGQERYLAQARLFVERRGAGLLAAGPLGSEYFSDHVPVRRAAVFDGHAVRALYLASGAVDVAVETGDDELLGALVEQWQRTVAARTYLTGGMGSRHEGEAFGEDFELPPDGAYAESCAAVASVMLAWRLLLATGEARFAELAERTLHNVIAGAVAADGRGFFYANPLQQRAPGVQPDPDALSPRAATGGRAPWFEVSCCPTNLARTLASLGGYAATADRTGLRIEQLAAAEIRTALTGGRAAGLRVATEYPWRGRVRVTITESDGAPWRVSIRVPSWASGATLTVDGLSRDAPAGQYAEAERPWRPGDELVLDLPIAPRWTFPDPRLDAVRGTVAVERGPLVYCLESVDLPGGVGIDGVAVDTSAPPLDAPAAGESGPQVSVSVPVFSAAQDERPRWPYGPERPPAAAAAEGPLRLVPYHARANRGPAAMRVFLPERGAGGDGRAGGDD